MYTLHDVKHVFLGELRSIRFFFRRIRHIMPHQNSRRRLFKVEHFSEVVGFLLVKISFLPRSSLLLLSNAHAFHRSIFFYPTVGFQLVNLFRNGFSGDDQETFSIRFCSYSSLLPSLRVSPPHLTTCFSTFSFFFCSGGGALVLHHPRRCLRLKAGKMKRENLIFKEENLRNIIWLISNYPLNKNRCNFYYFLTASFSDQLPSSKINAHHGREAREILFSKNCSHFRNFNVSNMHLVF